MRLFADITSRWKTAKLPRLALGLRRLRVLGILFCTGAGEWRQDTIEFEFFGTNVRVHAAGWDWEFERPKHALHDEATVLRQLPIAVKVQSDEAE